MKNRINLLLALFVLCALASCSSDEQVDDQGLELETADLSVSLDRSTTPCANALTEMVSNGSLNVGCLVDLRGGTMELPANVDLKFDGGDIQNGTLKFNGGTIDGRLLRKGVKVVGNVTLASKVFVFDPELWEVTQGKVSDAEALQNRLGLEEAMKIAEDLGGDTFSIDTMDAYFNVTTVTNKNKTNRNFYPWTEAINIPSNFGLIMTDNTKLRVQPNNAPKYSLLAIYNTNNSSITGGRLYGDRDEHTYGGGTTHEWGHLITVHGGVDASITDVVMKNGSGDGMKIESDKFTFQSNYRPSERVIVKDCTFDNNRRNNLSITGGEDLIIDGNTFLRAGADTDKSNGTKPKFQIDIEAHRKSKGDKLSEYERVDGVVIKNNVEREGTLGGFLVSIGENVILEDNDVQSGIAFNYGTNVTIRNNTLTAKTQNSGLAIKGGTSDTQRISGNKIYGNTIKNYGTGVILYSQGHEVYDNLIENCETGFSGKNIRDTQFYGNTIISDQDDSRGIFFHLTTLKNVVMEDNVITTKNNPMKFVGVNRYDDAKDYKVELNNNEVNSSYKAFIQWTSTLKFNENQITTGFDIRDSKDLVFYKNTVDGSEVNKHTFEFRGALSENILLDSNTLIARKGRWATDEHNSLPEGAVIERGNRFIYR